MALDTGRRPAAVSPRGQQRPPDAGSGTPAGQQPAGQQGPQGPQAQKARWDITWRLFTLTKGVRPRIAWAAALGVGITVAGVARLALQGSAVAMVFQGAPFTEVLKVLALALVLPLLRIVLTMSKEFTSQGTAALMKVKLRKLLYEHLLVLGPSYLHKRRTGEVLMNTVDAVEQLQTYYGQYLPQLMVATLAPIGIFVFMAILDLPSALIFLVFALLTLFAPTFFRRRTSGASQGRRRAFSALASEFVDAVQGLTTLKIFGQADARGQTLAGKARDVYRATMRVLAVNIASGGVGTLCMALGASVTLCWGAVRVSWGTMELHVLLIVLFLGTEIFRPLRELNQLYHQGLLAMAGALGMFELLDDAPDVVDPATPPAAAVGPLEPSVRFEHVSFAYESGKRPALEEVSFELPAGATLGLVGPSGAGKSTTVNLLFRFYDPQQGRIVLGGQDLRDIPLQKLREQIAVVAQDTYLFYGTVTENLRLGKPTATDEELVAAAKAANAHEFIGNLKDGYDTIIGERGQKLSGGQRQRIAVARAILKDAPILILDEATSHVDSENEAIIQEALERLMRERTTLIIAHRLSTVAGADHIVVLEGGRKVEEGRHGDLMAREGVYSRLVAAQMRAKVEEEADEADVAAMGAFGAASVHSANGTNGSHANGNVPYAHGSNGAPSVRVVGASPNGAAENGAGEDTRRSGLVTADDHAKPVEPVDLSAWATGLRLLALVRPHWKQLSVTLTGGVLQQVGGIALGVASAALASRAATALGVSGAYGNLIPIVLGLSVAVAFLTWFESWIAHDMAYRMLAEMRVAMFDKLNPLAPAYLLGRRSGDLASIITSDIETVESFFAHAIAPLFVAVIVPGIALTALAFLSWPLALVLLPFLVAVGLSPNYIGKHTERLGNHLRKQLGEVNAHMTDSVQGLREIVAFSQGPLRVEEIKTKTQGLTALQLQYGRQLGFQAGVIEGIQAFGGLFVLTFGAYLVTQGVITAALLPIATMLAFTCFGPVASIAATAKQLANAFGSGRRVFAVHDEPVAVRDGRGVTSGTDLPPTVRFEHVTFQYEPGAPQALVSVSFEARAGETVALVGRSGAGKTTAAHLLLRFWDPREGRITYGGRDLDEFELNDLRTRFSLVSQDTYLFNTSIRENLRLANPAASDEEVEEAARKACAHDFILTLPDGYNTIAGERGVALSGGQRQRLAIARALLKRAPVLILDEATSHLDAENERTVRAAIAELMAGHTTIVIAHRLSTVRDADRIIVLDEGRVAEQGRHEELLQRDGPYAQLIRSQLALPVAVPQPEVSVAVAAGAGG